MRKAKVLYKNEEAGILTQHDDGSFSFQYHDDWVANNTVSTASVSLYLKPKKNFILNTYFHFFSTCFLKDLISKWYAN
jgi:HipA-like protein